MASGAQNKPRLTTVCTAACRFRPWSGSAGHIFSAVGGYWPPSRSFSDQPQGVGLTSNGALPNSKVLVVIITIVRSQLSRKQASKLRNSAPPAIETALSSL